MSSATLSRGHDEDARPAVPAAADEPPDPAPALQGSDGARPAGSDRWWSPLGPYVSCVGYFVGAGLISGGIVHHPLDPARYGALAAAGAVVFLLATLFQELVLTAQRPSPLRLVRVAGASLLLSLGIGMLSGGIQHFTDFPGRGAVLVPAGLALSFVAHTLRHQEEPLRVLRGLATVAVLVLAVGAHVGLQVLADRTGPVDGGHSHGAPTTTGAHDGEDAVGDHGTPPARGPGAGQGGREQGAPTLAEIRARLEQLQAEAGAGR